jgi:hypothetical protein
VATKVPLETENEMEGVTSKVEELEKEDGHMTSDIKKEKRNHANSKLRE